MSIKKITFSPDISKLSAWGQSKTPFFAVIDFDGNMAAAPLNAGDFSLKSGVFEGRIDLGSVAAHFKFVCASPYSLPNVSRSDLLPRLTIQTAPIQSEITAAIRQLQANLGDGLSYLVNFCSQTEVVTNYSIPSLFENSAAPFTVWLEGEFIAFSPEAFVTVRGNTIATTPMKGTGFNPTQLLQDAKEQAEHATIVDLLRNDLGRVAGDIQIARYRYLTEIPQSDGHILYQTSTEITGHMSDDWRSHIGDWLPRLLPAGSVTGAPKKETVDLIRAAETEPRGFFTGIAALFDGENFHSAVLIRYLDLSGDVLKFRSGAGITIYSDPDAEYREILSKVYVPV